MPAVRTKNGVEIYYESHGEGFPLFLCYGLGGNLSGWATQVPALSQHYRVVVWDPRGHGQSGSPRDREQYGLDVSARDLLELMDHLNIPKAYVGGQSMGGSISIKFALTYPERLEALLVIDSAIGLAPPHSAEARARREKTIELALTSGMQAVVDQAVSASPAATESGQRRSAPVKGIADIKEMLLVQNPVGYAHSVMVMADPESMVERLSQITVPTLVLAGQEDHALPAARLTHERVSGSKLVVLSNAGHLSNLDQPDEFNSEVLAFLGDVDALRG